jgi:D-alanyl-D-alanine dipeptidase
MIEPAEKQDDLDAVPIRDNGEPLVDFLALCPKLRFSEKHPVFELPRVHLLRESVARMLCEAAHALPDGLYFSIVEGYRVIAVQRMMFRHAQKRARERYPDWNDEQIYHEAGRYSAPPDAKTPPPHITGGAVDLAIVDERGEQLDFISPFEIEDLRHAAFTAPGISETARANRELMRSVLEPTGLTNYADEWWHWSYGDNGWALRVGAPHAIYGLIELPPDAHWMGDMSKLPQE